MKETNKINYVAIGLTGGKIVQGIFTFPGGRRFHFSDPNGNEYVI